MPKLCLRYGALFLVSLVCKTSYDCNYENNDLRYMKAGMKYKSNELSLN